jgi:hypothetical protein
MNTHGGATAEFKTKERNLFNQLLVIQCNCISKSTYSNIMITNNSNKL